MHSRNLNALATGIRMLALGALLPAFALVCTSVAGAMQDPCPAEDRTLQLGFYAYFEPVSYSAERDPASPGFDTHLGYEADLLTALEKKKRALATFEDFSYTNKKEYVEWVTGAKREETRAKRVAQAVEWMNEGKPRNWKYMNC